MSKPLLELEGTWEEIAARAPELSGRRVRLTVLEPNSPPNERMLAALEAADTLARSMKPARADGVELVREARAGAMYGYEPCE